MLKEKTFLKVSDKQFKNLCEMCPQHEQRTKMLSNDHIIVRSQKSKDQTRSTRNMKQSYIQLVLTTFFITLLMPNLSHCQRRRGPPVIPHPNLRLQRGTSSSVVASRTSDNEEKSNSGSRSQKGGASVSCEPKFLEKCIKMANPLLKEPNHVFPSTSEDVEHVCSEIFPKTWSEYISCIKSFTSSCLSTSQRSDFNRAVGDSINSVHKMCTNEDYKSDYLRNAECIKQKAMDEEACKSYYDQLLEHIESGKSTADLCCAHDSFKKCVIEETKECPCNSDSQDWCSDNTKTATNFAKTIMENAIGFLLKQCNSIVSPVKTCKAYIPKRPRFEEPLSSSSGSSNGDFDGGYFPSGGSSRGSNNGGSVPSQIILNGDGLISTNYDQRSPKEVSQGGLDAGFKLLADGNIVDPQNLQSLDGGQRVFQTRTTTEISRDGGRNQGSYGLQKGTKIYKTNGGQHLLWPPETEITDFDEFLKNTLRAGASPQFSRGHSSASSHTHRPLLYGNFYQKLSLITKTVSLIIFYKFTTLRIL